VCQQARSYNTEHIRKRCKGVLSTPRRHRGLLCQAGHPLVSKLLAERGRDAKGKAALDKVGILDEGGWILSPHMPVTISSQRVKCSIWDWLTVELLLMPRTLSAHLVACGRAAEAFLLALTSRSRTRLSDHCSTDIRRRFHQDDIDDIHLSHRFESIAAGLQRVP
jgi:hypothetical protein